MDPARLRHLKGAEWIHGVPESEQALIGRQLQNTSALQKVDYRVRGFSLQGRKLER
eukprot:UN04324